MGFYQNGAVGTFDDFIVDDGTAGDTTAPTLSAASGTSTGSSTATGSVTTDEAGSAWSVLTTSSTTPTATQIKAGQDHTGAAAAASDTATLVVGANSDVFSFTGLTASTAYWEHVVEDDAVPNTSTPVTSASSFTTDAPSDTTAPTMNGSITVGTKTANSISISYPAASDNVAVTGYEVSSNGGSSWSDNGASLSYTFLGLTPLTSYDIRVRAYDAAGNRATPITVSTSTYRSGATGQTIVDTTGPVGSNPAGIMYNDVVLPGDADKWFSYRITSGPTTPADFTFNADGSFTYTGTSGDTFQYQLEVDGADVGSPQTVTVSSATATATPANSQSPSASTAASATQTYQATPAASDAPSASSASTATQTHAASPAGSRSDSTSTAAVATQSTPGDATPANSAGPSTSSASTASQDNIAQPAASDGPSTTTAAVATQTQAATPASSASASTSTSAKAFNINLTLDPDFAEYQFDDIAAAEYPEWTP